MNKIQLLFPVIIGMASLHASQSSVNTYFSPDNVPRDVIISQIEKSKKSIEVVTDSFTDPTIADALIQAAHRGVKVAVILDKRETTDMNSQAYFLMHKNIPVFLENHDRHLRDKFIVIDNSAVLTGSYSYTFDDPPRDSENLILISNAPDVAHRYDSIWQRHRHNAKQLNTDKASH